MALTEAKPDTKQTKGSRSRGSKAKATEQAAPAAAEDVPAVEDVTGKEPAPAPSPADLQPLFKTLLAECKKVGGRGSKETEKQAYVRVDDPNGKTVAYVNKPSRKHVRLEIPAGSGKYNVVKVATEADVPSAMEAVAQRHVPAKASK